MKKLFILTLFAISAIAAQTKWTLDRAHSNISFTVTHMMISDVTGVFKQFDAQVETSKEDFSDAKIYVTIQAKSIDTGNERRDAHLRSADFFNADVDSIITFKSKKFEKVSGNKYKLIGDLTMRGVTKEVMLDAEYKGKIKGFRGFIAAFKASTTINRKDWGLTWNRAIEAGGWVVGEEVTINIAVELNQQNNS